MVGCLFLALGVSVPAFAQDGPRPVPVVSVDVKVLNADIVILGKVSKVVRHDGGIVPVGLRGEADISVAVDETFKGEPQGELQRHLDGGDLSTTTAIVEMFKKKSPVLVIGRDFTALDSKTLAVPTADGTILHNPDDVIRYVREVLRSHPGIRHIDTFTLPKPAKWKKDFGEWSSGLIVPADAQLEKLALEYLRSNDAPTRTRGLDALRYFKSESNIALLKSLLNDPQFNGSPGAEFNKGIDVRVYTIRKQAYETLKVWAVDVNEPVLKEEVPVFGTIERINMYGPVADSDLERLLQAGNLKTLIYVLNGNQVIPEAQLSLVGRFLSLTKLILKGNIKDSGVKLLTSLTNLEDLDLNMSRVTDNGLKDLAALPNLKRLTLSGTRITDDGVASLSTFKSLKSVNLTLTQITKEGVARLNKLRPELEVEHSYKGSEIIYGQAFNGDIKGVRESLDRYYRGQVSNIPGDYGSLAMFYAVGQNHPEIVRLLLDRGLRVDVLDEGKATPLQWATRHGYTVMMKLLLDRGAQVNHSDEDGNTSLHFAARRGDAEPVRLLLACGANPSIKNRAGDTPLDLSKRDGKDEPLNALSKAPATPQSCK